MGLRINNNVPALNAQRQTEQTSRRLIEGFQRLASGRRINQAADDAAGLAIAERFRSRVLQATQELENLQTGVNLVQTAEGGLESQAAGTARLRELATQAANGTLTEEQRAAINNEAQQIIEQIGTTAEQTEFNGTQLLNGTAETIELGAEGGNQVNINESTVESLGLDEIDLSTQEGAAAALDTIATAENRISQNRANLGTQENRLTRAIEQRETSILNSQEAESRIRDLDIARQVIEQTRNDVLLQAGLSALVQGNVQNEAAAQLLGA